MRLRKKRARQEQPGIVVRGDRNRIEDNLIEGHEQGIDAEGEENRIERNTIIRRLTHPQSKSDKAMLAVAVVGVLVAIVFGVLDLVL